MELMTVVAIVGVLSAMAVPTFTSYVYKSRTTEAIEFLNVIRLREEAYRSEFGTYCPTVEASKAPDVIGSLDAIGNFVPNPSKSRYDPMYFNPASTNPEWRQLGAAPSGPVRFGYAVVAGDPSTIPKNMGFEAKRDFWWVARGVADLDVDGIYVQFETYSASKNIFVGKWPDGTPIDSGYE